jgi:hypothetical protein
MTQLNRIIAARGGKHPETDAEWDKYEADKAARRAKNVANAREILNRNRIDYTDLGPDGNSETLFTIHQGNIFLFYLPETGAWWDQAADRKEQRFGCRNLVKYLKGECS